MKTDEEKKKDSLPLYDQRELGTLRGMSYLNQTNEQEFEIQAYTQTNVIHQHHVAREQPPPVIMRVCSVVTDLNNRTSKSSKEKKSLGEDCIALFLSSAP